MDGMAIYAIKKASKALINRIIIMISTSRTITIISMIAYKQITDDVIEEGHN